MTKINWFDAAVRIAKIYNTHWECTEFGEDDDFIICPECEELLLLEECPEIEAADDKSFCYCPICEQRLDLI